MLRIECSGSPHEQHGSTVESQKRLERQYDKLRAGAVEKYGRDADEKTYLRQGRETEQSSTSTSSKALPSTSDLAAALPAPREQSNQSNNQVGQNQQRVVSDLPTRQEKT
ncbi:hypothetical protein AC579_10063 [Pseudocercospora musae]|uniref:Uncharacterized protein n=1 Tax=Pseudocercospora musae TaxID=113226 RepID=A0A139IGR1_9PEZI|nr:hypothetical protein AC579_10063 [Pseudocercospora musae]